jgi:hypothetical protein
MPLQNLSLYKHFVYTDVGTKSLKATCIHCDTYKNLARNPTCKQKHLDVDCPVLKAQREEKYLNPAAKHQRTIDDSLIPRIPALQKAQIDKELASYLYQTAQPLSMFEEECWIKFFNKNFGYTPPNTKALSDSLLDEVYTDVKVEVKSKLCSSSYLCLATDESTNIATNRVIKTSVVTHTAESFYWSNIQTKEETIDAKELAAYTIEQAKEITDDDLSK